MPVEEMQGPLCQSCGMPLRKPEDFGTARNGTPVNEYCHYCYMKGEFTNPKMTLSEMADFCAAVLARQGMPEAKARALMANTLPGLKRWRSAVDGAAPIVRA